MKKEKVKYNFNSFIAAVNYNAELLDYVPKIRQTLPKIKEKKLPKISLSLELAG